MSSERVGRLRLVLPFTFISTILDERKGHASPWLHNRPSEPSGSSCSLFRAPLQSFAPRTASLSDTFRARLQQLDIGIGPCHISSIYSVHRPAIPESSGSSKHQQVWKAGQAGQAGRLLSCSASLLIPHPSRQQRLEKAPNNVSLISSSHSVAKRRGNSC